MRKKMLAVGFLLVGLLGVVGCDTSFSNVSQDESAQIEGEYRITEEGSYRISGSEYQKVIVEAGEEAKVELVLEHVTIERETGSAIHVKQAGEVTVVLDSATQNVLSTQDAESAAIVSECNLIMRGDGSLSLSGAGQGIKGKATVTFEAGNYTIDTTGDCIHGQDVRIQDGSFMLSSGDDGVHADGALVIENGTVTVTESYEGLEGLNITINGGEISVHASDDGINAAGDGSEGTEFGPGQKADFNMEDMPRGKNERFEMGMRPDMGEMPERGERPQMDEMPQMGDMPDRGNRRMGGGMGFSEGGNASLEIHGGTIYVNAEGDGLDANGSILQTGGVVTVDGPTSGGNGALDYNSGYTMTGGTLVAVGSRGMFQSISEGSTVGYLDLYQSCQSGTHICVQDEKGTVIAEHTCTKKAEAMTIASEQIKKGSTYTILIDGVETEKASAR